MSPSGTLRFETGLDTSAGTPEEVDMVVAGQQRSWIDCCITQPR